MVRVSRMPSVTGIRWRPRPELPGPRGAGRLAVALAAILSAGWVLGYAAAHRPLASDGAWTDDRALAAVVAPPAPAPPTAVLLRASAPVEVLRADLPVAVAGPAGLWLFLPAGAAVLVVGRAGASVSVRLPNPAPAAAPAGRGTWVVPADGRLQLVLNTGRAQRGGVIMRA